MISTSSPLAILMVEERYFNYLRAKSDRASSFLNDSNYFKVMVPNCFVTSPKENDRIIIPSVVSFGLRFIYRFGNWS